MLARTGAFWLIDLQMGGRPVKSSGSTVSSYGSMAALIRLGTLPGAAALGLLTLLLTSP